MFREFVPILRSRSITITLSLLENDVIRANFFPMKLDDKESSALREPLSVEGSAEDLDNELNSAIVNYVATHLTIKESLERTKVEMQTVEKAAKDELNAAKAKQKKKVGDETEKKEPSKRPEKLEPPKVPNLFDASAETPAPATSPAPEQTSSISEEDIEAEILAESSADDDEDSVDNVA
jgi:PRTRC genetic system protein E